MVFSLASLQHMHYDDPLYLYLYSWVYLYIVYDIVFPCSSSVQHMHYADPTLAAVLFALIISIDRYVYYCVNFFCLWYLPSLLRHHPRPALLPLLGPLSLSLYIYIYVYTYIYVYICIYIYLSLCILPPHPPPPCSICTTPTR